MKMVEFARVTGTIAAPAGQVWLILTDFANPQRLAKSIEECQATGDRVGDTRIVRARSFVIHERIEEIDEDAFRFSYRAMEAGDMPMRGMLSYFATVTLRPRAEGVTEVEWRSEGHFDGELDQITDHLQRLYAGAISNLRQETEQPTS